jgi:hypothetical protein
MGEKYYRVQSSATGKAKVVQQAYRRAMREQGKVKVEDWPINNRAAKRRAKKGLKPGDAK